MKTRARERERDILRLKEYCSGCASAWCAIIISEKSNTQTIAPESRRSLLLCLYGLCLLVAA